MAAGVHFPIGGRVKANCKVHGHVPQSDPLRVGSRGQHIHRAADQTLAAADFARRERIRPALSRLNQALRPYSLRCSDGSEVVIATAYSEQVLLNAQKAITATELLSGEDPALLPSPTESSCIRYSMSTTSTRRGRPLRPCSPCAPPGSTPLSIR
jgi:hypothetical protein